MKNAKREAFLCQINSHPHIVNDQLVLQLVGTLAVYLSKCEGVSQALLSHEQVYPIGCGR